MRIGSGTFKGRTLKTPKGEATRPTSGLVRETLFNILARDIPEARVLDLFAGSGSVGLEALSRGAAHATFVEKARPALACLRENIAALGVADETMVLPYPVERAFDDLIRHDASYNLIFLDPPFADAEAYAHTLAAVADSALLAPDGVLVAQHDARLPLPEEAGKLKRYRLQKIGDNALSLYRANETADSDEVSGPDVEILRTKEARSDNLYYVHIYGLRIAAVNEGTDALEDPMIIFLREVLSAIPCAAHMSLEPWQDDQEETFSAFYPRERFLLSSIGSYCHLNIFKEEGLIRGVFFPDYKPDDLFVPDDDGDPLIERLLIYDQPNLYIGVDETAKTRLQELFAHPPAHVLDTDDEWFRTVTDIVPIFLAGGHDESCFHAITRSPEYFELLRGPLERTERAIRESAWFQENKELLRWSDEPSEWCLVLPCGRRERHRKCE